MMKKLTLCLVVSVTLFAAHSALARELIVALSPYGEASEVKQQASMVLKFLTGLAPGDSAVLVDGYSLTTIGEFSIPDNPAYKSPKARIGANRKAVGALMRLAKNALPVGGENAPGVTGALRLPQLLRYVAENFGGGETDVLILGSPFYDDPKEPEFSMAKGLIPGGGHLKLSRSKTPYGAADIPDLFTGLRVHFAYTGEMPSDRHAFYIRRFWTLFVEAQGGILASFGADVQSVFRRVKNKATPLKHQYKTDGSTKLEMIRLRRETVKPSIYERSVTMVPLPAHLLRKAEGVEVGLSWDCECDLDLYARPYPGAQILYFDNSRSAEGIYFKDFRRSPKKTKSYETIAFNMPIDLWALQVVVNFYGGTALQGVTGELRLAVGDHTYSTPITITATKGNKGGGAEDAFRMNRSSNAQTLVINPLHILKLR